MFGHHGRARRLGLAALQGTQLMMQPPRNDYLHPFHVHRAIRAPQGSLYSRHMSEPLRRGQHSEQLLASAAACVPVPCSTSAWRSTGRPPPAMIGEVTTCTAAPDVDTWIASVGSTAAGRTHNWVVGHRLRGSAGIAPAGRYASETPRAFVQVTLKALKLQALAGQSLLQVFQKARFSELPVTASDRFAALSAFGEIRLAVERRPEDGAPSANSSLRSHVRPVRARKARVRSAVDTPWPRPPGDTPAA